MELFTRWHRFTDAEPGLRAVLPPAAADLVSAAFTVAEHWHGGQRRPPGVPYTEHLLEALEVLVEGAGVSDPGVLAATVLHDVVEDTGCPLALVAERFGPRVAGLVGRVTIPPAGDAAGTAAKAAVKEAYLRGLASAPEDVLLVKLADRASNVQSLGNLPLARQRSYYAQTVRYIVPLAARVPWFARWYESWQQEFAALAEGDGLPGTPARG